MIFKTSHLQRARHRQLTQYADKRGYVSSSFRYKSLLAWLFALMLCNVVAMMWCEGLSLWQAIWLTFTTITSVGYGDLSAKTFYGQLATVLFLYVAGISILAQFFGEYIDYRLTKREKMVKGQWEWRDMKRHILIINTPERHGELYLTRLIGQLKLTPEFKACAVQILTESFAEGLPKSLVDLGVVHYHGVAENSAHLKKANAHLADYILIVAKDGDVSLSDSFTLDVLDRLLRLKVKAHIVAESVLDDNRQRFLNLGASAVLRPVRAYPEIMVRAMAAPGTEQILENLFKHEGDHPHRYDIEISQVRWKEVCLSVISAGLGMPLGYVAMDGQVITNPGIDQRIHAKALIVLVDHLSVPDLASVKQALKSSLVRAA